MPVETARKWLRLWSYVVLGLLFLITPLSTNAATVSEPEVQTFDISVERPVSWIPWLRVGRYENQIVTDGDAATVTTTIAIKAQVLFIVVYRYSAEERQEWLNGKLVSYRYSSLEDNGAKFTIEASRQENALYVRRHVSYPEHADSSLEPPKPDFEASLVAVIRRSFDIREPVNINCHERDPTDPNKRFCVFADTYCGGDAVPTNPWNQEITAARLIINDANGSCNPVQIVKLTDRPFDCWAANVGVASQPAYQMCFMKDGRPAEFFAYRAGVRIRLQRIAN